MNVTAMLACVHVSYTSCGYFQVRLMFYKLISTGAICKLICSLKCILVQVLIEKN